MLNLSQIKYILQAQKPFLQKKFKVKNIAIFGSFVRDEQTAKSDLDLLVEFSEPVSLLDIAKLEVYLDELLGLKTDVVPKSDIKPELKDSILKEAHYL